LCRALFERGVLWSWWNRKAKSSIISRDGTGCVRVRDASWNWAMARKNFLLDESRRLAGENMFVSPDQKSLSRGRRSAPRTEVCRPCLVWFPSVPEQKLQGVLLDLNPYGMKLRMLESLEEGTEVVVQMMRDDEFRVPLSQPIHGQVVRREMGFSGFFDHGVKVSVRALPKPGPTHFPRSFPQVPSRRRKARMHTADYRLGGGRRK
jgi:hypothetical protein